MIGISKLYCGTVEPSDALRYGRHSGKLPSHLLQFSSDKKPVVVWNVTRRCNLKCVHCYAHARDEEFPDELSTSEGKAVLDDLAAFGCPVVLFSGGEPLVRPDLVELAEYAVGKGMRAVISTNGTLINSRIAGRAQKGRPLLRRDQPGRPGRGKRPVQGSQGLFPKGDGRYHGLPGRRNKGRTALHHEPAERAGDSRHLRSFRRA